MNFNMLTELCCHQHNFKTFLSPPQKSHLSAVTHQFLHPSISSHESTFCNIELLTVVTLFNGIVYVFCDELPPLSIAFSSFIPTVVALFCLLVPLNR